MVEQGFEHTNGNNGFGSEQRIPKRETAGPSTPSCDQILPRVEEMWPLRPLDAPALIAPLNAPAFITRLVADCCSSPPVAFGHLIPPFLELVLVFHALRCAE
jgi:hypothetical protein